MIKLALWVPVSCTTIEALLRMRVFTQSECGYHFLLNLIEILLFVYFWSQITCNIYAKMRDSVCSFNHVAS